MVQSVLDKTVVEEIISSDTLKRLAALEEVLSLFDTADVRYWLNMGTLLGAVRSQTFIANDGDIDVGVLVDEIPKILPLLERLGQGGWQVNVTTFSLFLSHPIDNVLIEVIIYWQKGDKLWTPLVKVPPRFNFLLKYTDLIAERSIYKSYHQNIPRRHALAYALVPYWLDRPLRKLLFRLNDLCGQQHYAMAFPANFLDQLSLVRLHNIDFPAPSPVEDYLGLIYGLNWRIPNSNWKVEMVPAIDKTIFNTRDQAKYTLI